MILIVPPANECFSFPQASHMAASGPQFMTKMMHTFRMVEAKNISSMSNKGRKKEFLLEFGQAGVVKRNLSKHRLENGRQRE